MAFQHGKDSKLYANGVDLTSYMKSMTTSRNRDKADTTTFGAPNKTYIPGPGDRTLSGDGLYDNANGAIVPTLDAIFGQNVESLWAAIQGGGDVVGGKAQAFSGYQTNYEVNDDVGDAVGVSIEVSGNSGGDLFILHPKQAETAGITGAAVDTGAAGTTGGQAYLMAFSGTLTTSTIKVQHSADGSTGWADLITFSPVTAAPAFARGVVAGNVNRYVRALSTMTGTTLTWWLAYNKT